MALRHVLAPGGTQTVCLIKLPFSAKLRRAGHTAGHEMQGRICRRCRSRLMRFPQLVAAIAAELRQSGHAPDVKTLNLAPVVTDPNGCRFCGRQSGRPHHRLCDVVREQP